MSQGFPVHCAKVGLASTMTSVTQCPVTGFSDDIQLSSYRQRQEIEIIPPGHSPIRHSPSPPGTPPQGHWWPEPASKGRLF